MTWRGGRGGMPPGWGQQTGGASGPVYVGWGGHPWLEEWAGVNIPGGIAPGIHDVPYAPEGQWFQYGGHRYQFRGGRWYNSGGIETYLPIWFNINPFEQIDAGYWGVHVDAKPWPMWGCAHLTAGSPIALATHIEQMQAVMVAGYMAPNTALAIPIRDRTLDAGGVNEWGISLVDPAWPPMVQFRWNQNGINNNDYIDNFTSTTPLWSDLGVGMRALPEIVDRPMWDVTVRLEREPMPHWVLHVAYSVNAPTVGNRTFVCWIVGGGATTPLSTQSVEVGAAGVAGHYKIYRPFHITHPQQAFLTDGVGSLGMGARRKFQSRTMGVQYEYVQPANTPPPDGRVWLTEDDTSTGTTVLTTAYPPWVMVYGDQQRDQDRFGDHTTWRPTTFGMGCGIDGPLNHDLARSIEHPDADEYIYFSQLRTDGSRWYVDIYNYCNRVGAGGPRAPLAGTGNRHFTAFYFGVDAASTTAWTSSARRYWSKDAAAATMDADKLRQRALYVARVNVTGDGTAVYWTTDGLASGTSLFATGLCPMVVAMAADPTYQMAFTLNGRFGPVFREELQIARDQFCVSTEQISSDWITKIYLGGLASNSGGPGGLSAQSQAMRQVYVYAMGKSAAIAGDWARINVTSVGDADLVYPG